MILVIEDDLNLRDTICDILEASGKEVTSAENGLQGLQIANSQNIDLVICDVKMPIMDGLETIRRFRETRKHALVPFFFLSAFSTMTELRAGMDLGADDYLTKPFEGSDLLDTVDRLLNKYEAAKDFCKIELNSNLDDVLKRTLNRIDSHDKSYLDSMRQAKMVQSAVLPDRVQIKEVFKQFGLFHAPKEVVSGDFYWVRNLEGKSLIALGDCTGHGFPAALMTMVCSNALSISVDLLGRKSPKDILTTANELIIDFMTSKNSLANHGMDVMLCLIDYKKNELTFSGAKRPLYYISDHLTIDPHPQDRLTIDKINAESLYRIKGGCYSIGYEDCAKDIQEYTIQFKKGDQMYLSSDGYSDQLGGFDNKRFMSKRFIKLIKKISHQTLRKQEEALENSFQTWKGDAEQTDDVSVFIVRF